MMERDNQPDVTQLKKGTGIGRVDRNVCRELRRLREESATTLGWDLRAKGNGRGSRNLIKLE